MGQRLTDTAGAVGLRSVETHHRRAFRQPVAFKYRHASTLGSLQKSVGYPRTAPRGEPQSVRVDRFLLHGRSQIARPWYGERVSVLVDLVGLRIVKKKTP